MRSFWRFWRARTSFERGHRAETVLAAGAGTLARGERGPRRLWSCCGRSRPSIPIGPRSSRSTAGSRSRSGTAPPTVSPRCFADRGVRPGRRRGAARAVVDRLRGLLPGRDAAARDHDRHQHPARAARDREHPRPHRSRASSIRDADLDDGARRVRATPPADLPRAEPDDPVAIVWTSGTTGMPKGAVFDHRNLARGRGRRGRDGRARSTCGSRRCRSRTSRSCRGRGRRSRTSITTVITPTPWTAADALALDGARTRHGRPGRADAVAARARPSRLRRRAISSRLRIAGTGAATVPPELVREMEHRLGCPVVIGYTSTEAAITTGTVPGDSPEVISQTVGRPRVNVELEVVDDDGRVVPDRRGRARALPFGRGDARLLARPRRGRPRSSAPTAGSRPATSGSSTSAATSRSSAGAARCTSAAATTCTRPRSSGCCRSTRRSRRSRCSASPIRCSARSVSRSSSPRRGAAPELDELRTLLSRPRSPTTRRPTVWSSSTRSR